MSVRRRVHASLSAVLAATTLSAGAAGLAGPGSRPAEPPAGPSTQTVAGHPRDLSDLAALQGRAGFTPAAVDRAVDRLVAQTMAGAPVVDGTPTMLDDSPVLDNLDALELMELAQQARDQRQPVADVIRRYGLQDEFEAAADEFATRYPDVFAGAEINLPGGGAWFGFVGDVPAEVRARLDSLHAPSQLAAGLPHSLAELEQAGFDITSAAAVTTSSTVDYRTQTISVQTMAGTDAERATVAGLAERVASGRNMRVHVSHVNDAVSEHDGYARGGAHINGHKGGGYYGCTAGFVMRNDNGTFRMSTAGHCHKSMRTSVRLILHSGDGGTNAYIKNTLAWQDKSGDGALYTLGTFKPIGVFYNKPNRKASVRGWIRYPAKGSKVCKFGRKSGFTCGVITDSSFSWRGEGNLVVTKNAKSEGGDSGGPVFSGHTAYGVHMGTAYWGKRQVFTRLNGFADRKTRVLVY